MTGCCPPPPPPPHTHTHTHNKMAHRNRKISTKSIDFAPLEKVHRRKPIEINRYKYKLYLSTKFKHTSTSFSRSSDAKYEVVLC